MAVTRFAFSSVKDGYKFKNFRSKVAPICEWLVIAGGGGGGGTDTFDEAGGGGAGGYRSSVGTELQTVAVFA